MRKLCIGILLALLATTSAGAEETKGYLRLHIIANSDSREDQSVKLQARDAVLRLSRTLLENCASADEAADILEENLVLLEAAAQEAAAMEARAEMGVFRFPERTYGSVTVPAGEYQAVRIHLGAGRGRNWWCVLYPGLCVPPEANKEPQWKRILAQWCVWKEIFS